MNKEEAKEKIKKLVDDFSEIPKSQLDEMKEEQIKWLFIEPLLEALGWEKKEIEKEAGVLKGRADYILKNGNQEVLVVEAKKTNVSLTDDEGKQAVSYAYHRKIKFSILTNFKYLQVYHALSNIKNIGKNLLKVNNEYFRLEFKEFLDKFDILWLLSKESFEKGEINKLLSAKDEKINKPIDANILEDLLYIRELLSKELKSKKMSLSQENIDEVVQILIDRLIFIRSVEDRGLEPMNYLRSLESDVTQQRVKLQFFPYLLEKFEWFNERYDSKLFEKGLLEKEGSFSDDVLRKIILILYFGKENNQERYLFDQIPGDLFGSIYEQYLGTILAGTEKRVKLNLSSGKRKKMGIYYTPSYIVDYIVKNTVYEYIKDKSIDEILNVKILDPACGSGSFITRAFVEVCNVIKEKLNKGEEGSKSLFKKSKEKLEELNLGQKIEILRSCVYGIDLDEKAVELARLNLLLKLLDRETQETKKMLLPHLENNIKCGNSLINDPKVSDRAFKWQVEFKDVMNSGGFDVVVGNPPYIRSQLLSQEDKKYFEKNYISASNQYDIYILFIEKAILNLKKNGLIGFITPNKFLVSDYGLKLREFIIDNSHFKNIIDVSNLDVFKRIGTYPIVFILQKSTNKEEIKILRNIKNPNTISGAYLYYENLNPSSFENDDKKMISLEIKGNVEELCKKIKKNSVELGNLTNVYRGVIPPSQEEYVVKEELKNSKKAIRGRDIGRYFHKWKGEFLKYDKKLSLDKSQKFEGEKIIMPRTTLNLKSSLDEENLNLIDRVYYIKLKEKNIKIKYFLGLLNSKLIDFYYKIYFGASHLQGNYLDLKGVDLVKIPIHPPSPLQEKKILSLVNQMLSLQKKYHDEKIQGNEKERLKQQIDNVDYEIDEEIYKLYGITDEEKKMIGGGREMNKEIILKGK